MDNREASLAWLAGIIDGEGSICATFPKGRNCRPRLAVYNSNWNIITAVKSAFQQITQKRYAALERTKLMPQSKLRQWMIQVQRPTEVTQILLAVYPYLVGKREQARLAVELDGARGIQNRDLSHVLGAKIRHANLNPPGPAGSCRDWTGGSSKLRDSPVPMATSGKLKNLPQAVGPKGGPSQRT
jgi:hypothetical protein